MAEHKQIYERAIYYDIAFNRDVSRDVAFMAAAFKKYANRDLESVIDIACGPGYHARAFAAQGIRAVGLDLRPEMITYGESLAAGSTHLSWTSADMRDFNLDKPVDLALCMYDSIDCLLANQDMISHFRAVAKNLTASGLYIIECIHPRDCSPYHYGIHKYRGRRNGTSVDVRLGVNRPQFHPVTCIGEVEFEMRVRENGQIKTFRERSQERLYDARELELLAEDSGALEVVSWLGDLDLNQLLDNSDRSVSMVAVLQKKVS
ncbi:MAG: class I SAM-dependent methyltransferase [bacterium]|nr:class I SAM-dependent methyltransferase [bacterium]